MSTRGIPARDLPPHVREQLQEQHQAQRRGRGEERAPGRGPQLGPNSPLLPANDALVKRRNASLRKRSGMAFEHELAEGHGVYRAEGLAVIRQHHPAVVGEPATVQPSGHVVKWGTLRYAAGRAPCDFGGHARDVGSVLFDAKRVTGRATYEHKPEQYHQLEELRDHQACSSPATPARGFLLLADEDLGLAYLVEDLALLLARQALPLREGRGERTRHLWPLVRRSPPGARIAWDWLPVLRNLPSLPPR